MVVCHSHFNPCNVVPNLYRLDCEILKTDTSNQLLLCLIYSPSTDDFSSILEPVSFGKNVLRCWCYKEELYNSGKTNVGRIC